MPNQFMKQFSRRKLYEEIWTHALSNVAKKYDVPYPQLRVACMRWNIPLPTQSYWGKLYAGQKVTWEPLPDAENDTVVLEYSRLGKKIQRNPSAKKEDEENTLNQPALASQSPEVATITQFLAAPIVKREYAQFPQRNTYSRDKLHEEVWTEPVSTVAKRYGVSDVGLRKVCISLDVPLPPRGYWARKKAGQDVQVTPLPPHEGVDTKQGLKTYQEEQAITTLADKLSFLKENELLLLYRTCQTIAVSDEEKRLHPIVRSIKSEITEYTKKHKRDILANWAVDKWHRRPDDEPPFWRQLSPEILPRVYRIMDAIYTAIEQLGGKALISGAVQIRGEYVPFDINEGQLTVAHVVTPAEQKELDAYQKRSFFAVKPNIRKYDYQPNGKLRIVMWNGKQFRDTEQQPLESRLGEILISLYINSEDVRTERLRLEEQKRKEEEERRQRELRRERYNAEIEEVRALQNEASDYAIACQIRQYANAIAAKPDISEEEQQWVAWALEKADWFDPSVAANDPALGKRRHQDDSERKKLEKKYYWW